MKPLKYKHFEDAETVLSEGNRLIGRFMHDLNVKIQDHYYWLNQPYHQSWDALITVIKKIKGVVYREGYASFSATHKGYIEIGNALYDCDLEGAWTATVRWINLQHFISEVQQTTNEDLYSKPIGGIFSLSRYDNDYGTKHKPLEITEEVLFLNQLQRVSEKRFRCLDDFTEFEANYKVKYLHQLNNIFWQHKGYELDLYPDEILRPTEHAIKRFKERFMDIPEDQIISIIASSELLEQYKMNGDGKYPLKDFPPYYVAIENYKVVSFVKEFKKTA
jgi:hypothetical protein